jgi:adenylosuccinate synthase
MQEIERAKIGPDRLFIDPKAIIVTRSHRNSEQEGKLVNTIGSTGSGTGEAVIQRIKRRPTCLAKSIPELKPYLNYTTLLLRERLNRSERVIIEGTQGFGLSLLHSPHYPYVTSRDTTAAGFLSEVGLSPFDVDDIIMVIRTFPIRVAGNSGPLPHEIDWDTVTQESCKGKPIQEITSVTKRLRRVARFDPYIVNLAIEVNRPSKIVLNHLDYLYPDMVKQFIHNVQGSIGRRIGYLGYGPDSICD